MQSFSPPRSQDGDAVILIVDDQMPSLMLLEAAVNAVTSQPVRCCQDSREVMAIVATQPVAAILLDLRMPHLSGEELLEKLHGEFPEVPVLIVTGDDDVTTAVRCIKIGAFDYVVKPVDINRLSASLKNALLVSKLHHRNRTTQERAEQQILQLLYYDSVTGLPNRKLLRQQLEAMVVQGERHGRALAVLSVGIDHFKRINESLGHVAGDQLLKAVAGRLQTCLRQSDGISSNAVDHVRALLTPPGGGAGGEAGNTVARIGGDEFVIVLNEIRQPQDAARVAERIHQNMAAPFQLENHSVAVAISTGISQYPTDGKDAVSLLRSADAAMQFAKRDGRNRYQFHTAEINDQVQQRLNLEYDLQQALLRDQFVLHYQPRVDLKSGQITGAEALVRWQQPNGEMVPPGTFIPLAEETGLIVPLGEWILRTACQQLKAWQESGAPPLRVSVNLSPVQFRDKNLTATVIQAVQHAGIDPEWLELELTETSLIDRLETTLNQLRELKMLGVWLAIDDFGTGYSSLSYLKRFPIDILKIDQSFVRDIDQSSTDNAILEAIIALGHSLRLRIIGEGVETPNQLVFLRQRGCEEVQGYMLSRPLPAEQFLTRLRQTAVRQTGVRPECREG